MLGLDPGFRTGCKVVCLDAQGNLLHNEAIYPHPPRNEYAQAQRKLQKLVEQYDIQAIAIGNGTASRETESFVQSVRFDRPVEAFVVSEDGASIYSASKIAREEFPEYDVTVRGAVSIGRRLMDPLAEFGEDRPEIHRCRTIPARRGPDETAGNVEPYGRIVRECRGSQLEYRELSTADLRVGSGAATGTEYRGLPTRKTVPSPLGGI